MHATEGKTVDCFHAGLCLTARLYRMGERAVVLDANITQGEQNGSNPLENIITVQRRLWWMANKLAGREGLVDVVPGMNNLTLVFDPLASKHPDWLDVLGNHWEFGDEALPEAQTITLPVRYGDEYGPDLTAVAAHSGLTEREVIDLHTDADYLVMFLGFQPGFAYLNGLPEQLFMPRKETPELSVAAGSVGIGGSQTAVYPFASPGGWQIIGRCDKTLFDPQREPASLMLPGDYVKFIAVDTL